MIDALERRLQAGPSGRGVAVVSVDLPDNLTTYRIMAVAVDRDRGDRLGSGEARVTTRKPLLLRPALPRFLAVGDRFQAAVSVHNNAGRAGTVQVLARARRVSIAGARVEVRVPAGEARLVRFSAEARRSGRTHSVTP